MRVQILWRQGLVVAHPPMQQREQRPANECAVACSSAAVISHACKSRPLFDRPREAPNPQFRYVLTFPGSALMASLMPGDLAMWLKNSSTGEQSADRRTAPSQQRTDQFQKFPHIAQKKIVLIAIMRLECAPAYVGSVQHLLHGDRVRTMRRSVRAAPRAGDAMLSKSLK